MEITTIAAIGAGILAVVVIVAGVISVRSERDLVEERLVNEMESGGFSLGIDESEEAEEQLSIRDQFVDRMEEAVGDRAWAQKWRQQLSRADLKLKVSEYIALHFVAMVVAFTFSYFIFLPGNILVGILAGFIGLFFPRIYVARQVSARLRKFEEQLPDTLGLWINGLRSGYSVMQSMEAISRDSPEPTATEFARVVQEVQLGIDIDDALDHMLARMASEDLDLVFTAVSIQRQVGGNLAEILEVIQHTIRERIKLKGEIRVMTTQGRYTGYLISLMPIIVAVFLSLIRPGFMEPLFTNRLCGWPLIGIGLALIGIGTAAIQKIVDIEI
jgi:tight adherence protein B